MARRRTLNYREMRADFDEDEERRDEEEGDEDEEEEEEEEGAEGEGEAAEGEEGDEEGDDEEAVPVKKKKPKPKPKRTRAVKVTRKRVVWCVFNNSHQEVATYEFPQKAEAEAHAAKLMAEKKTTHFVNPVKKDIVEEKKEK